MACGLPALVTNISGSQDLIIQNYNGIFTSGLTKDIADKLELIMEQDVISYGNKCRAMIEENYSDSIVLNKHISIFQDTNSH